MTARVEAALRVVRAVAGRADPTRPLAAGELARRTSLAPSGVSRLCAELVAAGLLARGEAYGSYRAGPAALELSGRAASPWAPTVRAVLTRIAQRTGETSLLAARTPAGASVVGAVPSPWTLRAGAVVGEEITDSGTAVLRVLGGTDGAEVDAVESTLDGRVEVAVPVREPGGDAVAVLAVRIPAHRGAQGLGLAHRALAAGRRALERIDGVGDANAPTAAAEDMTVTGVSSALAASLRMLRILAAGETSVSELAVATGLRRERVARLMESCRRAGAVAVSGDGGRLRLEWSLHGWLRAASSALLVAEGAAIVAETAERTGVCAFITVLRGTRSVTLVEELRSPGPGLEMRPWLGRPCPILSSDGGPALVMDFERDDIAAVLPPRVDAAAAADFLERVEALRADGVVAREAVEEVGMTGLSAPIRDASGAAVAAACLVGGSESMRPRMTELSAATRRLASELSAVVFGTRR